MANLQNGLDMVEEQVPKESLIKSDIHTPNTKVNESRKLPFSDDTLIDSLWGFTTEILSAARQDLTSIGAKATQDLSDFGNILIADTNEIAKTTATSLSELANMLLQVDDLCHENVDEGKEMTDFSEKRKLLQKSFKTVCPNDSLFTENKYEKNNSSTPVDSITKPAIVSPNVKEWGKHKQNKSCSFLGLKTEGESVVGNAGGLNDILSLALQGQQFIDYTLKSDENGETKSEKKIKKRSKPQISEKQKKAVHQNNKASSSENDSWCEVDSEEDSSGMSSWGEVSDIPEKVPVE